MIFITLLFVVALFLKNCQAFVARNERYNRPLLHLLLAQHSCQSKTFPSIDKDEKVGGRDITSHICMLDQSLRKISGEGITERIGIFKSVNEASTPMDVRESMYQNICLNDRWVLISHGIEDDPIYNFANVAGLQAFYRTWNEVTNMPSRKSVVLQSFDEKLRIDLMESVTTCGFVEGATSIRVRGDGQFLRLVNAVVWNCFDDDGTSTGQAALFDREVCPVIPSLES